MAVLKLDHVSLAYSKGTPFEKVAVEDFTHTFRENAITGLIGHTGSGKSTVAQMFNGLLKPDCGTVSLDGTDIWQEPKNLPSIRFRIGIVFQYPEYQLFDETVFRDIAFGPRNMGLSDEEIEKRVLDAAEFACVDREWLDISPFELSGGQKRRVAIAGVMAMDPEILVLDEPAAGLDPAARRTILDGIRRYQVERMKTVIMISHSMEDMAKYADEIVVMYRGTVALTGTPAEIFRDAERVRELGLSVPQITLLCQKLRERGVPVSDEIFTVDQAHRALAELFREKGGTPLC